MKKYIHVGFPKNFSTSLQRDYFSVNDKIFHLGIGIGDNLGYVDHIMDSLFEVYLKSAKTFAYQLKKREFISHIANLLYEAQAQGKNAFGASSEHLSFAFTYDGLAADVKADRLLEIFGKDTEIIIIIRNQIDLIRSLFRESVRVGFKGTFRDYVYYLYKYQDRNYFADIHYHWFYDLYAERFGAEHVHVLLFEEFRSSQGDLTSGRHGRTALFEALDSILGVATSNRVLGHYNEALTAPQINSKIELNKIHTHDLGNHLLEVAEKHRLKNYLQTYLELLEDEQVMYADVLTKRRLIDTVKKSGHQDLMVDYNCDERIWNRMLLSFDRSNECLFQTLKRERPAAYKLIK